MNYPFKVYRTQVEAHLFWVAECSCLKGCVGQGDTLEDAINELEENEAVWLETAKECGISIPEIPVEIANEYSGKFTVRVAPFIHKSAVAHAQEEGISLNQYVNDAIVEKNAKMETLSYLSPELNKAIDEFKDRLGNNQPTLRQGCTLFSMAPTISQSKGSSGYTESGDGHYIVPVNFTN